MSELRQMYIGGSWAGADSGATFADYNPASGEAWAEVADAGRSDARRAIEAAQSAFPAWSRLAPTARAGYRLKVADILERRQKEIAALRAEEGGAWVGFGMFEAGYTPGIWRAAAALCYQALGEVMPSAYGKLSLVVREPIGVVAAISPWNAPLLLSSRGIAVALAMGNTVVLKPSEETPVAGGVVLAQALEEANLPKGVFNLVTCSREHVAEVGDELIENPAVRCISFTGSTAVGKQIGAKAGGLLKRACLELGGKDALIVLDDADMERALGSASFGSFMHQGQICMSVEKIVLHQKIAAEFTERFVELVKGLKSGDPREPGNVIGPIINQKQLDKIAGQVDEAVRKGAKVLAGGTHRGLYYDATVLANVTREMAVYRDETFGPVAPLVTVQNDDEAVAVANDTEYGLSAGIITRDEQRGLAIARRLQTGIAHINCSSVNDEPWIPFGGVKSSGVGRHGGSGSVSSFTETRWITADRGGRPYPPPFMPKK
jgi:acyl-CoA reductase-like NAD-dependent aldehyde dehydrogenase